MKRGLALVCLVAAILAGCSTAAAGPVTPAVVTPEPADPPAWFEVAPVKAWLTSTCKKPTPAMAAVMQCKKLVIAKITGSTSILTVPTTIPVTGSDTTALCVVIANTATDFGYESVYVTQKDGAKGSYCERHLT